MMIHACAQRGNPEEAEEWLIEMGRMVAGMETRRWRERTGGNGDVLLVCLGFLVRFYESL